MTTENAVLFLVFNRPNTTLRVFDAIRAAQPPRLYVVADGPRTDRGGEAERCERTRAIATAVDWPCKLTTLMRPQNLGCKRSVSSGITWFFEHETQGIILEDDCLPDPSFFQYCDALLERYRNDGRVFSISGDNFISSAWKPEASYYFSRYAHIWGWATWRRAWQHYDPEMSDWDICDKRGFLARSLPGLPRAQALWQANFDRVTSGRIDTWDYQWTYACWKRDGANCMPESNLICNIGFGEGATHTISAESKLANLPVRSIALPLRHPPTVQIDDAADRWTNRHIFEIDERLIARARELAVRIARRTRSRRVGA